MHSVLLVVIGLLAGAAATTSAEYLFKYNLLDLIIEKLKGLLGKAEADAGAIVGDIKKKL